MVFSTSVFHRMSTSSIPLVKPCETNLLGETKKYKRIKKYFHFTHRSNSYNLIAICSKYFECLFQDNKGSENLKLNLNTNFKIVGR